MPLENILILNDFGHINGGAAQVAITSALGLAARGYRVFYFCAVPPIDPQLLAHPNIQVVSTDQSDILHNPNRMEAFAQGLWNRNSATALGDLLQNLPAANTIVHVHGWTKALSASLFSVVQRAILPTVVTLHDYFLACPNGGFYNYPRQEICHLTPLSPQCILTHCDVRSYPQKLWRVGRGYVQKYIAHLPAGIKNYIVVSQLSERVLAPYLPPQARIFQVPNPVEVPRRERVRAENNRAYFVVGRLNPEKGIDLAARATAHLGLPLEIVGEGPQDEAIRAFNPAAISSGWMPHEQMLRRLQDARAIIFPSKWYETQGLVVSEAAALGIPSIVSDVTAAGESIIDGQTGLLFQSSNLESLIEKIALAEDDAILNQMSQQAYDHYWAAPKSVDEHVDQLIRVYRQILDHPASAGEPSPQTEKA